MKVFKAVFGGLIIALIVSTTIFIVFYACNSKGEDTSKGEVTSAGSTMMINPMATTPDKTEESTTTTTTPTTTPTTTTIPSKTCLDKYEDGNCDEECNTSTYWFDGGDCGTFEFMEGGYKTRLINYQTRNCVKSEKVTKNCVFYQFT